ncbi:MAG: tRNA(Ile)(2)-agmatinylcytidine synthase [Methanoregulaceae archaeon]|nr:tRNA(Ile)(2)-agmatinylcytidine synthase [Methanoregulaceae archaeon]
MLIGIDDTDSPEGMCTTYLGAVLAKRLVGEGMGVSESRLIRLNPNVRYKTRGNAAICLEVHGDMKRAFALACRTVEELACFAAAETNPGIVITERKPQSDFYHKAVKDFCTLGEALAVLEETGAVFRGYKNQRGLIGATAAVCSDLPDFTYELLAYRKPEVWGTRRIVNRDSLFLAERTTYPHTWDTVDPGQGIAVCVPHTPDPVLFGIRGERPGWISYARECVLSEKPGIEHMYITNQGTDAHLQSGRIGELREGRSYMLGGMVTGPVETGRGGHISVTIGDNENTVRCMAYEPTKGFREIIRQLREGDLVVVAGSFKGGSINLEKIGVVAVAPDRYSRPPVCPACNRRMTSAGSGKGFKCRRCGGRAREAEVGERPRGILPGWFEVTPSARRHLAKPLCRGEPDAAILGCQPSSVIQ